MLIQWSLFWTLVPALCSVSQIGGEIVDLIVVLRSVEALKAFCGDYHLAVGASVGAAAGPVGRILEADVRAGRQGLATAYTYSCAKGGGCPGAWLFWEGAGSSIGAALPIRNTALTSSLACWDGALPFLGRQSVSPCCFPRDFL